MSGTFHLFYLERQVNEQRDRIARLERTIEALLTLRPELRAGTQWGPGSLGSAVSHAQAAWEQAVELPLPTPPKGES